VDELLERFNADNETIFDYGWDFSLDGPVIINSFGYDEILLKSGIYKKYSNTTLSPKSIVFNYDEVITRAATLSHKFITFNSDEVIIIAKIKEFMK
jgi:hypothetical protein